MIKSQSISLNDIIIKNEGNIASDMGREKVMLSVRNGKYYNLGDVGGVIWENIDLADSVGGLINNLLEKYEVDRDKCEEDVLNFLWELSHEGLIKIRT